jgi:16S rRNA (guanine966-N2)-methyltransferase
MRVVAGEARGRQLQAPPGRKTRPTSDRVREAIFNVLGSLTTIDGLVVADLFAGSGALGIEALSRGAARVVFVDADRQATSTIRTNLARTGLARTGLAGPQAEVVQADVLRWLAGGGANGDPPHIDLAMCDPPYAFADWPALLDRLAPVSGMVVLESGSAGTSGAPLEPGPEWEVLRVKRYGGTVVTVARPER